MESAINVAFCGSEFWNNSLTWDTEDPDFTKCFEKSVLVWVPCAFLWIFSPYEIYFIKNSKKKEILWNWLNLSKIFVISALIVINISDLVNSVRKSSANVDIYSPIIKCVTFLFSAILIYYNRRHGLRISGHQFLFWFLLTLCGIPQFRTEIRGSQNVTPESYHSYITYIIHFPLVVLMFFLNCFADKSPKEQIKTKNTVPLENASFLSKLLHTWFDSIVWLGYRRPLENKDLWDLKREMCSKEVVPIFQKNWQKALEKQKRSSFVKTAEASVIPAICYSFGINFLFCMSLKVLQVAISFVSPQILNFLISYAKEGQHTWHGYFYASILFVNALTQTLLMSQFNKWVMDIGMGIKTSITSAVYRKSLIISNESRKERTVGQIVNLMAVDANRFTELPHQLTVVWTTPLQILLAIFFLWRELGPSILAGLAVMIVLIPVNSFIANKQKQYQMIMMRNKDERVKLMNEILSGIKVLKLYAWEKSFEKLVSRIRSKEIKILKKVAYLNSTNWFIFSCTPFMVSLVTFATYVLIDENNVLDANKTYVSISLFNLLSGPLKMLPMTISNLLQAYVSIKRINNFMNCNELEENNVTHEKNSEYALVMENCNFSWGEASILKNVNIHLPEGSLTAVVGSVGSGKSSLISAFLGEMDKTSGRVNTVGSIAYVAQQAWIQNATLRDNILFGKDLDEKKYRKVVKACALLPDFEMLPGGDQTEIGEKGINLSGGQKQRVSLARAVYADADIYFLDDPLSAVDSHVGKHIFENVIGPTGILRRKTRVLVTHGITYLPQTDQILVITKGEVSESGSYQELMNKKGAFAEFMAVHINDPTEDGDEFSSEEVKFKRQVSQVSQADSEKTNGFLHSQKSVDSTQSKDQKVGKKLIEKEKAETGRVARSVFKYYLEAIGYKIIFATLCFSLTFQGFSVGSNIWLGKWADDGKIYVNHTVDVDRRNFYLEIYGFLGVGQVVAIFISFITLYMGTINASNLLHRHMLNNILKLPTNTFFDVTPVGRILNRFAKEVDVLDTMLPNCLKQWILCFFTVLGTFFVISYSTPIFIVVMIPLAILYFIIQRFYVASTRQLKRIESISASPIFSHFGETLTGVQCIRAFGQQERFILQSEKRVDENQRCHYPNLISHRWLEVRLELIGSLIIFFAAMFAVMDKNNLPGLVGLSVAYALQITSSLNMLVRMTSNVETNIISVERMKEYIEAPREAPWDIPSKNPKQSWPEIGTVEFRNYAVRYRPGLDLVLKGVNFSVNGGEKIGIVGRTGAGKSSLTLSLLRIIEAAKGDIYIDGVKISELGLHALRSRLTIIPQDAILFSGTLRMNVDPFEIYSDEDVWRSLEHAHLKTFVKNLPAGLQHAVTEGGENLSVGQRQLICLARALLRKTKVLILDEATAAVDLETDDLIQKTIRTEFKDCTVLTIAHRLNTIMDSDRVLVLDKGEIVEFDSPSNLLLNTESIFYGMCRNAGLA